MCNIDRDTALGLCHSSWTPRISRVALHMWEEPIISGTNGSGTIFFTGCNMDCVFCQNYAISHENVGRNVGVNGIVDGMRQLVDLGANNINFVNPTHYVDAILEALAVYKPPVPVLYNTSSYERVETIQRLEGLVDIYLPDYKYNNSDSARRYSGRANYPDVAWDAIREMVRQKPFPVIEDGLMKQGVIIRHLVLPGLSGESVELLERLYAAYGEKVYYSIMSQYTPYGRAVDYPEINRPLKALEYTRAVSALRRRGATNVFVQESTSSDVLYIPQWDDDK